MALTTRAVEQLGAVIQDHDGPDGKVTRLPSGLYKTERGSLIAPPSKLSGDTKTGKLASVEDKETPVITSYTEEQEQHQPLQQEQPAKQPRKRQRKQSQPQAQELPADMPVRVGLVLDGLGTVPSAYSYCSIGDRVVVLGVTPYSYIPPVSDLAAGELKTFSLDINEGHSYIYVGHSFKDKYNTKHIILLEI